MYGDSSRPRGWRRLAVTTGLSSRRQLPVPGMSWLAQNRLAPGLRNGCTIAAGDTSRLVEHLQKIGRASQIGIKSNEHASSDRPDHTLNDPGEILDDSLEPIGQYRVAVNCLMTEANSPRTLVNDVPGRKDRAKPPDLDPTGGMCEVSLQESRCRIGMRRSVDHGVPLPGAVRIQPTQSGWHRTGCWRSIAHGRLRPRQPRLR